MQKKLNEIEPIKRELKIKQQKIAQLDNKCVELKEQIMNSNKYQSDQKNQL